MPLCEFQVRRKQIDKDGIAHKVFENCGKSANLYRVIGRLSEARRVKLCHIHALMMQEGRYRVIDEDDQTSETLL